MSPGQTVPTGVSCIKVMTGMEQLSVALTEEGSGSGASLGSQPVMMISAGQVIISGGTLSSIDMTCTHSSKFPHSSVAL